MIGNTGKALPAYATIPILSLPNWLMICETICLLLSKRFGATSSASILLETSMANTMSIPSRFTVSILVPIFGFTKPRISPRKAKSKTITFKTGLKTELSGLSFFTISKSPNSRCFFLFQYKLARKTNTTKGSIKRRYKYFFSSNSIIFFTTKFTKKRKVYKTYFPKDFKSCFSLCVFKCYIKLLKTVFLNPISANNKKPANQIKGLNFSS